MKESKQLKVTDLRIGDKVRDKRTKLEFVITGIIWHQGIDPTDAILYLDFLGGEWGMPLDEVELLGKGGEE